VPELQLADPRAPGAWDGALPASGARFFHSEAWARHRAAEPRRRALHATCGGVTRAVVVETTLLRLPGRPIRRLEVDSPALAGPLGGGGAGAWEPLLALAERRHEGHGGRGVVELSCGSLDARAAAGPPDGVAGPDPLGGAGGARAVPRWEFVAGPIDPERPVRRLNRGTRSALNRARREGVVAREDGSRRGLEIFAGLYAETLDGLRRRKGVAIAHPGVAAFADRLEVLVAAGRGRLFLAADPRGAAGGEAPLGGCFFGTFGDEAYYLYGVAARIAGRRGATALAVQHGMATLSAEGCTRFNLGGAGGDADRESSPDHGLWQFKRGFGAEPVRQTSWVVTLAPVSARLVRGAAQARHRAGRYGASTRMWASSRLGIAPHTTGVPTQG
jgi:hypothetical protein